MPLRDVATSDSILLTEVPEPSDEKAMRSIRRLQEIGVGVVADAAALAERPVDNAVALVAAKGAASAAVPDFAARDAVVLDGTETQEEEKVASRARGKRRGCASRHRSSASREMRSTCSRAEA